ncbi:MAG TPA: hypothetical protein VH299_14775 [Solirubrobacterales bacterium]|jgi:hypothetical protein|nr:hypothetical protein [Solirubrobacterales bacterium]
MGRLRAASLLLVALAVGFLLASCGGGGNGELLPGTTADQITSNLDLVRESVNEENCEKAEDAVATVSTEVDELKKVDKKLKTALEQGAAKLSEVVSSSSCGQAEEEAEQKQATEEEAEDQEQSEEEQFAEEEEQKAEEKAQQAEEKAQEKAEKEAEQPGPPEEGEESGPNGKAKGHEGQEEIEPPSPEEEVTPPGAGGGGAGGIGPGAAIEGGE